MTPEQQIDVEKHEHLRTLLEDAVAYYRHNLFNTPAGKPVLEYLHQDRALKDETIEAFGLGYAPDAWEAGLTHFKAKGYQEADLIAAGLVTEREIDGGGDIYDRFRHRVTFPIEAST